MRPFVELEDVDFAYGAVPVLERINLTVEPGDFLGIIGPNGSGKTTLLRIMLGLLPPTSGTVRLFGHPPASFRQWGRLGYVPQRATLDASLPVTVHEVVATGLLPSLGIFGRIGAAERKRIANDLRATGAAEAEKIRADADRQREVLLAEAYRDAQRIRGDGDAKSAAIYAAAFNQNPEFYSFYRSMEAYRSSFRGRNDLMLLETNSDFLRYFRDSLGRNPATRK